MEFSRRNGEQPGDQMGERIKILHSEHRCEKNTLINAFSATFDWDLKQISNTLYNKTAKL